MNFDRIKKVLSRMTAGPWRWWTSNSFRRLSSDPSGKDGDVAYGCVHSDGHPDIAVPNEYDMEGIALLRNEAPALLAELERLQALAAHVYDMLDDVTDEEIQAVVKKVREALEPKHLKSADAKLAAVQSGDPYRASDFDYAKHKAALTTLTDAEFLAHLADAPWSIPHAFGDGTVGLRVDHTAWEELIRRVR